MAYNAMQLKNVLSWVYQWAIQLFILFILILKTVIHIYFLFLVKSYFINFRSLNQGVLSD